MFKSRDDAYDTKKPHIIRWGVLDTGGPDRVFPHRFVAPKRGSNLLVHAGSECAMDGVLGVYLGPLGDAEETGEEQVGEILVFGTARNVPVSGEDLRIGDSVTVDREGRACKAELTRLRYPLMYPQIRTLRLCGLCVRVAVSNTLGAHIYLTHSYVEL